MKHYYARWCGILFLRWLLVLVPQISFPERYGNACVAVIMSRCVLAGYVQVLRSINVGTYIIMGWLVMVNLLILLA